jgi:diaminopimelate epimerase
MVNVGNPHFVLFVDSDDFSTHGLPWQQLGAKISTDPLFQFGTNVEFVRIVAPDHIEFRIFERGVGPTHSSGTGTCASSAAAIALRDAARDLTATSIGGPQQVSWPSNDAQMMLTGPAEVICHGEVEFA